MRKWGGFRKFSGGLSLPSWVLWSPGVCWAQLCRWRRLESQDGPRPVMVSSARLPCGAGVHGCGVGVGLGGLRAPRVVRSRPDLAWGLEPAATLSAALPPTSKRQECLTAGLLQRRCHTLGPLGFITCKSQMGSSAPCL